MKVDWRANCLWVWWKRLHRRNGRLTWVSHGAPFNRRKLKHWFIAGWCLWRDGKRPLPQDGGQE